MYGFSYVPVALFLMSLTLLHGCAKRGSVPEEARFKHAKLQVTGEDSQKLTDVPSWYVQLLFFVGSEGEFESCSGTAIASGVILTAKDCLEKIPPQAVPPYYPKHRLFQKEFQADGSKNLVIRFPGLGGRDMLTPLCSVKIEVHTEAGLALIFLDENLEWLSQMETLPLAVEPVAEMLWDGKMLGSGRTASFYGKVQTRQVENLTVFPAQIWPQLYASRAWDEALDVYTKHVVRASGEYVGFCFLDHGPSPCSEEEQEMVSRDLNAWGIPPTVDINIEQFQHIDEHALYEHPFFRHQLMVMPFDKKATGGFPNSTHHSYFCKGDAGNALLSPDNEVRAITLTYRSLLYKDVGDVHERKICSPIAVATDVAPFVPWIEETIRAHKGFQRPRRCRANGLFSMLYKNVVRRMLF